MHFLPPAFAGFTSYRQFVVCQFIPQENGKTKKMPVDLRTMYHGSIHDTAIWMDAQSACAACAALGGNYGVGFVFTVNDPFFFIDIDNCMDPQTGELSDIANEFLAAAGGAAIERSQSGTGLHIFGRGSFGGHKKKNVPLGIEFYTELRFAALTGIDAQGSCDADCTTLLASTLEKYFPPQTAVSGDHGEPYTTEPREGWDGPTDDDVLIAKMLGSGSAEAKFSNTKASFADLFNANETVLSACYPEVGDQGRMYGASEADAALAQHLAFWTGCQEDRIDRIMRRSALARDKWDERAGYYLPLTIKNATARQTEVYNKQPTTAAPAPQPEMPSVAAPENAAVTVVEDTPGIRFMSIEQQKIFFNDYVYVADLDQVFTPENGRMWKQANFKNMFSNYTFALDANNDKTTTNAWQAFCSSQGAKFKKVHDIEFRADYPEGNIRTDHGDLILNTYLDRRGKRTVGDATPFLDLMQRMLPDENDRVILLSYMAAVVQHIGVKFRYCPVVQGTEGNGKSTLANILEYAVGERYTHKPSAMALVADGGKFNGWMAHTILVCVEDIHIDATPGGTFDAMKPLITNERVEIQAKGRDQKTGPNRGNWYISVNRKEDVPITDDSRRYCIFFTAQQNVADKIKSGMTDEYWSEFWAWMTGRAPGLEENHGYAVCHNLLAEYQIPDMYNPVLLSSAPRTSSTAEAVVASRSEAQEIVAEAIAKDQVGFRGGWVSSHHIDALLDSKRRSVRANQRRTLMEGLGYTWHPAMHLGRVSTMIEAEGMSRPVLYVLKDSIANLNISSTAEAKMAYMKAQGYIAGGQPTHATPVPANQ